ncbi:DUF3473 domain-containing protein [bacterium]|nr:DUF3473 domain-containing protein [bacterium]
MGIIEHCFSVDVEDWYQVENLSSVISRSTWDKRERRVVRNMDRLLGIFDEANVKVTCFILGKVAREFPELVKKIADKGHEVASHGEDHLSLYSHNPETFRSTIDSLKKYLEDVSGQQVIGYRAPNFTITKETWWALDILAECGYLYDSSVFPFKRKRYGVKDAPIDPYKISLTNGLTIAEFPPTVINLGIKTIPIAGGGYFRLYPTSFMNWAIKRLEKNHRVLCFYIHPWEIDPGQPKVSGIPFLEKRMHYLNLNTTEKKLKKVFKKYSFRSYGDHFREKEEFLRINKFL